MVSPNPWPLAVPTPERSHVVVEPPGPGPGNWVGAATACLIDGTFYLTYRLRRPEEHGATGQSGHVSGPHEPGRGYAVVIAASADGVTFEPLQTIGKDEMGTVSLERPALTRTEGGVWRLYLSCATAGTKHWRIELLEAADPAHFDPRTTRVVLPGSDRIGVKDPVIVQDGGKWHLWASCHPLEDPATADRMTSDHATSTDGVDWAWQGTVLSGRPGRWDSRGTRITSVIVHEGRTIAYYDGRASAAENWEERTGVAVGDGFGLLVAQGTEPAAWSPYGGGGLRYVSAVPLPDGRMRLYYELTRSDGAHELRTELVDPITG